MQSTGPTTDMNTRSIRKTGLLSIVKKTGHNGRRAIILAILALVSIGLKYAWPYIVEIINTGGKWVWISLFCIFAVAAIVSCFGMIMGALSVVSGFFNHVIDDGLGRVEDKIRS